LEGLDAAGFFSSFDWEEGCCTATWSVISFVMCYSFLALFAGFGAFSWVFLCFGFFGALKYNELEGGINCHLYQGAQSR